MINSVSSPKSNGVIEDDDKPAILTPFLLVIFRDETVFIQLLKIAVRRVNDDRLCISDFLMLAVVSSCSIAIKYIMRIIEQSTALTNLSYP